MASKYEMAPLALCERGKRIIDKYHGDLSTVGVTIDYILGYAAENDEGEVKGPALKEHGFACYGVSTVTSLKNRVKGMQDAEIILDGNRWPNLSEEQQDAILDHQISHLIVSRNVEGEAIFDDSGRPKLKLRLHDFSAGWFRDVANRHGADSFEVTQASTLFQTSAQVFFPFVAGSESVRPLKVLPPPNPPKGKKKPEKPLVEEKVKKTSKKAKPAPAPPAEPVTAQGSGIDPDAE